MNALMSPGAAPQPGLQAPPAGPPAPGAPAAAAPQAASVTPEHVAEARAHIAIMLKALLALAKKPQGSLSKRDLYDAAGEMIADGAFPTSQAKAQLVAQLAQIPDDEAAIRQAVGAQIMQLAQNRSLIDQTFGGA